MDKGNEKLGNEKTNTSSYAQITCPPPQMNKIIQLNVNDLIKN